MNAGVRQTVRCLFKPLGLGDLQIREGFLPPSLDKLRWFWFWKSLYGFSTSAKKILGHLPESWYS